MCDKSITDSCDNEVVKGEGFPTSAELRPAPTYPECSMSASFVGSNCPGLIGVTSALIAGQLLENEVSKGLKAESGDRATNPHLVSSCTGRTSPGRTGGLRPSAARLGTEGPAQYNWCPNGGAKSSVSRGEESDHVAGSPV